VPCEDCFEDQDGKHDFIDAADLEEMALRLISRHQTRFGPLGRLGIVFQWKAKGGRSQGKVTLGRCQKTAGLLKKFSKADLVIWAARDNCEDLHLSFKQMEALIFHELLHADVDTEYKPIIKPHEFEGFSFELQEYGTWSRDLEHASRAFRQTSFFDEERTAGDGRS
jgi:hypothetical protein